MDRPHSPRANRTSGLGINRPRFPHTQSGLSVSKLQLMRLVLTDLLYQRDGNTFSSFVNIVIGRSVKLTSDPHIMKKVIGLVYVHLYRLRNKVVVFLSYFFPRHPSFTHEFPIQWRVCARTCEGKKHQLRVTIFLVLKATSFQLRVLYMYISSSERIF